MNSKHDLSYQASCLENTSNRANWLSSLNWQIDFYQRSMSRKRLDMEFEWEWLEQRSKNFKATVKNALRKVLDRFYPRAPVEVNQEWINRNATLLWESRELLFDDLSKLLFDSMLTLRASGYHRFYFPRIDFSNFVTRLSEEAFTSGSLPIDYLGIPIRQFKLMIPSSTDQSIVTVISTRAQIDLLNSYRQYFIKRGAIDLAPAQGDVVLDCGACIGEISMVMAGLVGKLGEIHLFDPVPLHARYCELQASLNPHLSHHFHINVLAVGSSSLRSLVPLTDLNEISPGGIPGNAFSTISIDDYVSEKNLSRINFIKMDIEGSELSALNGATNAIQWFRPRLAISTYHKPEDLWEIPHKLMELNSSYKLFFGHHSPIDWESVYYAV